VQKFLLELNKKLESKLNYEKIDVNIDKCDDFEVCKIVDKKVINCEKGYSWE
jgi:hypothetical protein